MTSPRDLILRGLLLFPPTGKTFPGRGGKPKAYLVNARGAGADPCLRGWIVDGLCAVARSGPAFDVVGGISKSGTSWGAWLAWAENLPFANILMDGPRVSGLQREVEGDVRGQRVVLVDNWARSGDSIRKAVEVVARAGGETVAAITIVRNGAMDLGLPFRAAWEIRDLLAAAEQEGLWTPSECADGGHPIPFHV